MNGRANVVILHHKKNVGRVLSIVTDMELVEEVFVLVRQHGMEIAVNTKDVVKEIVD